MQRTKKETYFSLSLSLSSPLSFVCVTQFFIHRCGGDMSSFEEERRGEKEERVWTKQRREGT